MSQKVKKKKAKTKKVQWRDKKWFKIVAPKSFNFMEIGEVIGLEDNVVGRVVDCLLYDFSNNFKDISLKLNFKIVNVNSESKKCNSIFVGHEYTSDYVRALVGRGSTKIATILNLTTKDGFVFRLTTVCITIKRARSSQKLVIRKIVREILKELISSLNHEKVISGIVYGEFQNQIQRIAKTIYPLSSCTIIKSKLLSIPEGGEDKEFVPQDEKYEIVEVNVQRTRKSDIKRTERINVKKFAQEKAKPIVEGVEIPPLEEEAPK